MIIPNIVDLPQSLLVNGHERDINSDYRMALWIFRAFDDPELGKREKLKVMAQNLYEDDLDTFEPSEIEEALNQATWFLNGGSLCEGQKEKIKPVMNWEQDQTMIFSAVNRTAGLEVRSLPYLHWWSFLGYLNESGETMLSTVISIRSKLNEHTPLEKYEKEFLEKNRSLVELKTKLSQKDEKEKEEILKILKSSP